MTADGTRLERYAWLLDPMANAGYVFLGTGQPSTKGCLQGEAAHDSPMVCVIAPSLPLTSKREGSSLRDARPGLWVGRC